MYLRAGIRDYQLSVTGGAAMPCREWGFFQVVDHGIRSAVVSKSSRETHNFFSRLPAEKQKISRTAENPWGFYDQEPTKNTADWKLIYDYADSGEEVQISHYSV